MEPDGLTIKFPGIIVASAKRICEMTSIIFPENLTCYFVQFPKKLQEFDPTRNIDVVEGKAFAILFRRLPAMGESENAMLGLIPAEETYFDDSHLVRPFHPLETVIVSRATASEAQACAFVLYGELDPRAQEQMLQEWVDERGTLADVSIRNIRGRGGTSRREREESVANLKSFCEEKNILEGTIHSNTMVWLAG